MQGEVSPFWVLWPFDRTAEIVIVTAIVAVLLPLWFHIFMYWTTRRRKFVGREFYDEVNVWLAEMRRKYAVETSRSAAFKKSSNKKNPAKSAQGKEAPDS